MTKTQWAIAGPESSVLELDGHKFGSNDDGAPMLCSQVCRNMGRHLHIDYCRATSKGTCNHVETQHIMEPMNPNPTRPKDWVTHGLSWSRLGWYISIKVLYPFLTLIFVIGFKGAPAYDNLHFHAAKNHVCALADPYSRDEQANFAKWCVHRIFSVLIYVQTLHRRSDAMCSGIVKHNIA